MPNFKKHATIGAAVGGSANLAWQVLKILDDPNRPKDILDFLSRINIIEVAVFGLAGAAFGTLPDLIEPATNNPRHRALFHSLACAGCIGFTAFGEHTKLLPPKNRHALQVAALSYLSHLLLDGDTPDGLPITGLSRLAKSFRIFAQPGSSV